MISIGIVIAIMLISGILVAMNSISQHMVLEKLDDTKIDFRITSNNQNYTEIIQLFDNLTEEEHGVHEYELTLATIHNQWYQTYIQPGGGNITWSNITFPSGYYQDESGNVFNNSHFCGFSHDIFTPTNLVNRFSDTVRMDSALNLSQYGVYLDQSTAQSYNLRAGDTISLGYLYQAYRYDEGSEQIINYTASIPDLPILDVFTVSDRKQLGTLFSEGWWDVYFGDEDVIFFGNISIIKENIIHNYTTQFKTAVEANDDYWYYEEPSISYGILIDHQALAAINPNQLKNRITQITTRINILGRREIISLNSPLTQAIEEVIRTILLYQGIYIAISIPVLILGWFLSKTNWSLSFQNRRRELALLKTKGGGNTQLRFLFILEAIIIGVFGGFIGIIGGNLTSNLILKRIFPEIVQNMSFWDQILSIITGKSILPSTWLIAILGGVGISILSIIGPLKEFMKLDPIDGLQKYHENIQSQLPKHKRDWVILIAGLIPVIIALISQGILGGDRNNDDIFIEPYPGPGGYNPFFSIIVQLSTILLPMAPFAIIYASVRLLCRNINVFQKIITSISKVFDKPTALFSSKSIIRNQARSFRLVFIVAMALSFVVMTSTIEHSEMDYQDQIQSIESGNGYRLSLWSYNIQNKTLSNLTDTLWENHQNLTFNAFNYEFTLKDSGIAGDGGGGGGIREDYYYGGTQVSVISGKNFSQYIAMRDEWFIDITAEDAMKVLYEENKTLVPSTLIEQGYRVGDDLEIQYSLRNGTIVTKEIEIGGVYNVMPLITTEYMWVQKIVVDNATIPDGVISGDVSFTFYPKSNFIPKNDTKFELFKATFKKFDQTMYVYEPYSSTSTDFLAMEQSLIRFLNLENLYLLTIVIVGITIIMFISINEKAHDMGLLRARGVKKSVLYKVQMAEGGILIFIGMLFTFIGIIGGGAMILQLNNLFLGTFNLAIKRKMLIPWGKIILQLLGSLAVFLLSIAVSVTIETRKSNVTKISDLLRVDA